MQRERRFSCKSPSADAVLFHLHLYRRTKTPVNEKRPVLFAAIAPLPPIKSEILKKKKKKNQEKRPTKPKPTPKRVCLPHRELLTGARTRCPATRRGALCALRSARAERLPPALPSLPSCPFPTLAQGLMHRRKRLHRRCERFQRLGT